MSKRIVIAWVLAATALALWVAALIADRNAPEPTPLAGIVAGAATLVPAILGLLVALRRPDNAIAWLLIAQGICVGVVGFCDRYAAAGLGREDPLPGWRLAVAASDGGWPLLFASLTAIALVFPHGRPATPRLRRWLHVWIAAVVVALAIGPYSQEPYAPPYEDVERLPGPAALAWLQPLVLLAMVACILAAARSVRQRLKASRGIERQQLRWLAYAAALIPLALVAGFVVSLVAETDDESLSALAAALPGVGIPAAIAVAVSRYRLYDIDRLVNRTLVYATLTALLAIAFGLVSVLAGLIAGGDGRLQTAAATLAVAVAFGPLRRRVQDVVDRRFNRARYDALRRVRGFVDAVHEGHAEPERVGSVLGEALGDPAAEVRFWLPESRLYVDAEGEPAGDEVAPGRTATPVERGEMPLGLFVHDVALAEKPDTLDTVLAAAGPAIEIARLRVEVRRQLAEVAASRARIVSAGEAERHRLERDLHDGAQQRLVTIGLALRHVQHGLPEGAGAARSGLDDVVQELSGAIQELRELAGGLRPARLNDGLMPALRDLAARAPLPVDVSGPAERYPDDIEAAAYFVAGEALTNVIKHAGASRVRIATARENGRLLLRVSDDGSGGAQPGGGSGLTGLADRVQAHGGILTVDSKPGEGTTIEAELPCGS